MLSVHTGIAAQDTQRGGELCAIKSLSSGSILSIPSLNGICQQKEPVQDQGELVN